MRHWILIFFLAATPATAQDEPGFFERLFSTDSAESDVQQGSLLEGLIEDALTDAGRIVTVSGFNGALSGEATLESLTIEDEDGTWLTITDATLNWNRAALFRGRLEITELAAEEILLPRLPASTASEAPSPEARGFQLPDLPVSVEIGRVAVERVVVGEEVFGVAAVLSLVGSLSLVNGSGATNIAITRSDQPGEISLDAQYENTSQSLSIDLSMREAPDGILVTLAGLPGAPSVDFSIAGNAPLSDFTADIDLATDGTERLAGQIALSETENAQRIVAAISGDIAPVFAPQYRDFFGDDLSLDAEALLYSDGRVELPEFSLFAQELALFGKVALGTDRLPEVIDITGRIAPESNDPVRLPIGGAPIEVDRANLTIAFDAAQSEEWRTGIRLVNLTREGLDIDEIALRATGRLGTGASTTFGGDLTFETTGLNTDDGLSNAIGSDLTGSATVEYTGGPLNVRDLRLAARDLTATGNASFEDGTVSADASIAAAQLANFSELAGRALGGRANLQVSGQFAPLTQAFDVAFEGETIDLSLDMPQADAVLAGQAEMSATAVRDSDGLRISLPTLASAAARLAGEASLRSGGSSFTLEGRLNETSVVLPGISGASDISLAGLENDARDWTLSGTVDAPAVSAEINGVLSNIYDLPAFQGSLDAESSDLSTFSEAAGRALSGQLQVALEGGANADLSRALINGTARGRDISIEGIGLDRVLSGPITLEIEGQKTEDRIDIANLAFGAESLIAQGAGTITELLSTPVFDGKLSASSPDLSVFSEVTGRPLSGRLNINAEGGANADVSHARLKATADGQGLSIGIPQVDALLQGALNLSIDAARDAEQVNVSAFSLKTDSLSAQTAGQLGAPGDRLSIEARLADVSPFVSGFSGALSVDGTVGREAEGLVLEIDANGPGGTRASVAGQVAEDASSANLTIDGTAPLALANQLIAPRSLTGISNFVLRLNGPPSLENVSGRVGIENARLAAPTLPTGLDDITGTIDLSQGQTVLNINSRVESGGALSVSGPLGLTAPNAAGLRIGLSQVRATDNLIYETTADGEISIDGPLAGGASISGQIALGETNIQIPSSGLGGTGAIPEITHIREPPPVRGTRRKAGLLKQVTANGAQSGPVYPLNVQISAPNRVFVRGRGLDSEFGGALRVTGTTANIVPSGAFNLIRGRLDILGQRLSLQEASITLQGGLLPFLDIAASTNVEDTEITVEVLGRADSPEIQFTSSPELPEEEVLARLIFGRGLETLSPIQAARLALAVRTLAGQGGEGIVGNIRGGAGLADLDVTTSEDGNAAVRAGAYLGENIYSDVTVDSSGETQLNLNLDVSPSLTVRGGVKNDGSSSLGIFFERDY
ncbi:MAG: translocation/assembly module TamB domain-containing protein [Pseudomonadota bacterium]